MQGVTRATLGLQKKLMTLTDLSGRVFFPIFFTWCLLIPAYAGPLNDTGIDFLSGHGVRAGSGLDAQSGNDPAPFGAHDARFGRDAAALYGVLPKTGGSAGTRSGNPNGFDFTKISNTGAALPKDAALGSAPNAWACTYDNNTGLMWEVKVADATHLRYMGHTYSWYRGDGREGELASGGTCHSAGRCDTAKYVVDVNAVGLCGHHDWRLPTKLELANIVDRGRSEPAVDPVYFVNTPAMFYWTSTVVAGLRGVAWQRSFKNGAGELGLMEQPHPVRLVRKSH